MSNPRCPACGSADVRLNSRPFRYNACFGCGKSWDEGGVAHLRAECERLTKAMHDMQFLFTAWASNLLSQHTGKPQSNDRQQAIGKASAFQTAAETVAKAIAENRAALSEPQP